LSGQKRIAQIFLVACCLILAILTFISISQGLDDFVVLVVYASYAIVPIPLFLWGITLFIRYIRLFQDKLEMSKERLWIETIFMNVTSPVTCYIFYVGFMNLKL